MFSTIFVTFRIYMSLWLPSSPCVGPVQMGLFSEALPDCPPCDCNGSRLWPHTTPCTPSLLSLFHFLQFLRDYIMDSFA